MGGGGAERQLTYLAEAHVRAGWDVHVALISGGPNLSRLQRSGAVIHRIDVAGNHDPRLVVRLRALMKKIEPDVVQCWLLQMDVVGGLAAWTSRIPWVFSERASEEAYPKSAKLLLRRLVAKCATAIVSNSAAGDEYWRARTSDRVPRYIIPNGIPVDEIAAAPPARADMTGVADGIPLVLHAGRMVPQKNFETLIRAMALVRSTPPVHAICCGEGPLRPAIERLVAEQQVASRVRVTAYVEDLWSLMKRATVLVSPSFFEGNPNVVLEAMASGCPLIVSDIPTHREFLDEDSAILVDPNRPDALAVAMARVIEDPEGAARRARVARQRVEKFSLSEVGRRYADVYRDLLVRPAAAPSQVAL
jgi:glycosyltransferase involved in cell wall biosynthesis